MTSRWIAAFLIAGALATQPVLAQSSAQSPASKDVAPAASTPASPQAPNGSKAAGDPNVSYPLANGGTYQAPLTGQPDPTTRFYQGYSRT